MHAMRSLILSIFVSILLMPAVHAQEQSSSASSESSGSGAVVDIWTERAERAEGFSSQWSRFALVHSSWIAKWQKVRGKLLLHIDRCHDDVRSANRDTLLPVSLQCYRGQLLIERDALKNERDVIDQWPGLSAELKTAMLARIDALQGALQPIIDAIDAKVFTTLDAFRDVRENLRTQYRQPYWFAAAQVRNGTALTWLDALLLSLKSASEDTGFSEEVRQKITDALECYAIAEPFLIPSETIDSLESLRENLAKASGQIASCSPVLSEAQALQHSSSSSSSL